MKKLPTLFRREFQDHHVIRIMPELSRPELSWVLAGEGVATEKIDGACCAFIDGQFYKRYDAKKNKHGVMKTPPAGAIPCDAPDPVTGHGRTGCRWSRILRRITGSLSLGRIRRAI